METEDAQVVTVSGEGDCRDFRPGYKFTLLEHPRDSGDYVITSVRHSIVQESTSRGHAVDTIYENSFACVPAAVRFRPRRATPWPRIRGPQTAFVIGDEDQELGSDEYGRIRVQFIWDRGREGQRGISCWARVAHAVAGSGWGLQSIPRVGHEVVVEFLDGDPDRPLVVGSVYNGTHKMPYVEPTRSGWRTRTTPDAGAANYNEIMFEDQAGEEKLGIQAEKDMHELVKNDQHVIVRNNRLEQIDGNRHERVGVDHREEVGQDRHLRVVGKQAREVGGSDSLTVSGDVIRVFDSNHSERTSGGIYLDAGGDVVIEAANSITLVVGGSSCVVDNTGVTLTGSIITLDGSLTNINSGAGSSAGSGSAGSAVSPVEPDEPVALEGEMGETSKVSAPAHKPPKAVEKVAPKAAASEEKEKQDWIEIELVDGEGKPMAGEKYEVKLPDGSVASGTLDEKGYARVDGVDPGKCQVTFPDADQESWKRDG
jgi:type VI secretion system secreted protein VgrG